MKYLTIFFAIVILFTNCCKKTEYMVIHEYCTKEDAERTNKVLLGDKPVSSCYADSTVIDKNGNKRVYGRIIAYMNLPDRAGEIKSIKIIEIDK